MNVFADTLPRIARHISALVALSLAGALALAAAPANADLGSQQIYIGGVIANCSDCTTGGNGMPFTKGSTVRTEPTLNAAISTSSSGTTIDGTNGAVFFCIDQDTPIGLGTPIENVDQATAFSGVSNPSSVQFPNRVKWVLANGATYLNTSEFAARLSAAGVTFHGGLTAQEAIFGTQWAIWNFSEGNITPTYISSMLTDTGKDVFAVARWLIDNADPSFIAPALSLTPPAATSGAPGANSMARLIAACARASRSGDTYSSRQRSSRRLASTASRSLDVRGLFR